MNVTDSIPPDDARDEASRLDEIIATRRAKIAALREGGIDPYPVRFRTTATLAAVRERYTDLDAGVTTGDQVTVAGRVVGRRQMGKLQFLVLREDGADLQLMCAVNALDETSRTVLDQLDIGDWVGAHGEVLTSKRGELSVQPTALTVLGKGLRPLPDKWHGLTDTEVRFRQREVDLTVNLDARRVFEVRSATVRALRAQMDARGFVEVETPMLHPIPGGAAARPFVTHHNALDADLYLRIAPELYLKRLIAGGMRRVYEINRNFRNEGMSARHNPEFTMLESYAAYDDYTDVMELTEALFARAAEDVVGSTELSYQGRAVSLAAPFRRVTLLELVREATDTTIDYDDSVADVRVICDDHDVAWEPSWTTGKLVLELYESLVEHTLWEPTFVTDYPVDVSPLARRHRDDPRVTERFELIVTGRELANAFSELVDPVDQRARLEAQARARAAGDEEAMVVDEAYLRAMEFGMPPAGGLGIGVDRLVMLLADVANIRDVILFPTLRPEHFG
ncbi:MAG: lysine--tRNA ligase [Nitriliruptoraceae bacterium]